MPNREKVIAWLADEELYYRDHGDTHNSLMACDALNLLKEHDPVKPKKGLFHMPTTILFDYECECGVPIMKGQPYCMSCGKAVKWDD